MRLKHRRRMARIGQISALDPPRDGSLWAAAAPPRSGCALDVLIDGAAGAAADRRRPRGRALHVHIAGWHVTPGLRPDPRRRRAARCASCSASWPSAWTCACCCGRARRCRCSSRRARRCARPATSSSAGHAIRCALDARERPMHCHHEKLVDRRRRGRVRRRHRPDVAGRRPLRLRRAPGARRARLARRGDAPARPGRRRRRRALRGALGRGHRRAGAGPAPPPGRRATSTVQIVRTVPERVYDFAPAATSASSRPTRARCAQRARLIYLENQFLWSPEIVAILRGQAARPAERRLPARRPAARTSRTTARDDTRGQLGVLADADDGGERFLAATVRRAAATVTGPLYVHAKVGIVDDRWLTVGSANLNEHSLFNDSEMNVVTLRRGAGPRHAAAAVGRAPRARRRGGRRCPAPVVDELWRPVAAEQLARRRAGAPPTHRLCELPGVSRRARTASAGRSGRWPTTGDWTKDGWHQGRCW